MKKKQCGYHSCACIGVEFISSYDGVSDFCVEGQRVTIRPDRSVTCDADTAQKLNMALLDRYAAYLNRRATQKAARPGDIWPDVEAFRGVVFVR